MELVAIEVEEKLQLAQKGRNWWLSFTDQYNIIGQDFVVLIPSHENKEIYAALQYITQLYETKKVQRLYLITQQKIIEKLYPLFTVEVEKCLVVSPEEMDQILSLYALYPYTDRLAVASLTLPKGRTFQNLIGKRDMTIDEIMSIGIYQNKTFVNVEKVKYEGKDEDVQVFFASVGDDIS